MSHRTVIRGLGIAAALAAGAALGDDSTSRLLLERAQRADAFTLGVQQSMDSARAGTLGPRERLELDTRQRDQRRQQDALFYRQQILTHTPATDIQRRTETMRGEQERQEQLSRYRFESGRRRPASRQRRASRRRSRPRRYRARLPARRSCRARSRISPKH